jgi:hypothetical protein
MHPFCDPMVFIKDEEGTFQAPVSKVWELLQSPQDHQHPSQINPQFAMDGEHPVVSFGVKMPDGKVVNNKIRVTPMAPVGYALEYLEAPFAGSRSFTFYSPKGDQTGVTVVGDYTSQWMTGDALKQAVALSLENAFREDQENLKHI